MPAFRGLRFKILFAFLLILVVPLALSLVMTIKRIENASAVDFSRRLGYAANLFRESLEDRIETLRIRAKTLADFDLYQTVQDGTGTARVSGVLQSEVARSGLEFAALVRDGRRVEAIEGTVPNENLARIVSLLAHSQLNSNLLMIHHEPWLFASAEIVKARAIGRFHVIIAMKMRRDAADRLKNLTGAQFSLVANGRRVLTTLMDPFNARQLGPVEGADLKSGSMEILGTTYHYVREEALPSRISEVVLLEIALPQSEFVALAEKVAGDLGFLAVLAVVLALATGTYLAWHIAQPITALAETTTRVAGGDFTSVALPPRNDEIGLLDRNFQEMIQSLRTERDLKESRMRELKTLFEVSNAVNFLTDSEELLKFILSKSVEIFEAERGSIMLLDDQTDELVVKVATGGRYRVLSSSPVKLGYGICGLAAREGTGRIANDGFKNREFRDFGSLVPVEDIQSLMCSPLKFKEGTIGVINIVNRRNGGQFIESDLALLNLIASQAAVTIENNKLYELSITDGMTRLFVHRYFLARLSEELLRARRYSLRLSLIMIDIDNFKKFNDTYGHQTGDLVLQRVAQAIRDTVRTGIDIACRYGGEEMAIILPETRSDEAFRTAERVRESINQLQISHPTGALRVTVSIGVASYPGDAHDRDSLVTAADKAMYYSKRSGKNCSTLSSQIPQ